MVYSRTRLRAGTGYSRPQMEMIVLVFSCTLTDEASRPDSASGVLKLSSDTQTKHWYRPHSAPRVLQKWTVSNSDYSYGTILRVLQKIRSGIRILNVITL